MPIDYHRLRMLMCKAVVGEFLRRWGIYLVAGAAIFGAGSNAPLAAAMGLAGLLVLPLTYAAHHGVLLVWAAVFYALLGWVPVALTRPLWWPRHWAAAERALPLAAGTLRRSDRVLALWVMLPWQGLLLLGVAAVWWHETPSLDAHRWWMVLAWAMSALGSLGLSTAWMRAVRYLASVRSSKGHVMAGGVMRGAVASAIKPTAWFLALLFLPLVRGPAKRSAGTLIGGVLLAAGCALCALWTGIGLGWSLAALALVSLGATSMLRARTREELSPLLRAAAHMPLPLRDWARARTLLVLTPVACGLVAVLPGALRAPGLRSPVLWIYLLVLGLGCVWDAAAAEAERPSSRVARWLFSLALAIAIGSEVTAT